MTNSSHSEEELLDQNPNSYLTQNDENQQQEPSQSDAQYPQIKTLETPDPPNTEESEIDQPQDQPHQRQQQQKQQNPEHDEPQQQQQLEGSQFLAQEENQVPADHPEQSGMSLSPPITDTTISELNPPPITDTTISELNPPPLTSSSNPPRRPNKRKKCSLKKQQAIEKKLQTLSENLKPIPFVPSKTLDFLKHEKLLKRLGLWDFVHIEFDQTIRVDLVVQLIANYDSKLRCSYVNEFRIAVNRADLARAFKLPVKKEKGTVSSSSSEPLDLDSEELSEESVSFIEDFVSNWVLLHEDTWMMPTDVLNWTRAIRDRHPEKVDWASLIWVMVEKELMQGQQLEDCYYASHLQYLIKSQREAAFGEEPKVEEEVEVKEEEDGGDVKMDASDHFQGQEDVVLEEPDIELTLGQDKVDKEEVKDEDLMNVEECKEQEHGQWLLDGKNNEGEHFLQRCSLEEGRGLDSHWEGKQEDEEEEEEDEEAEEEEEHGDGFDLMPNGDALEGDVLTGNLLEGMETNQIPFSSPGQIRNQSAVELLATRAETHMILGGPNIFGNGSKREIEHEHDISHHSLNGSNKRLRTDGSWDHKSSDFGMCMEQVQHWMGKARMMHEMKEQAYEESNMNQQYLLSELQQREGMIEHLHKVKMAEIEKRDREILRLERDLYLMGNLLEGYRRALKENHRSFSEYRQRCQLPEEPLYKDAGPGGVMLSTMELEKQLQKREEEDRVTRLMIEGQIKEFEEEFFGKLELHFKDVHILDERLMELANELKLLQELSAKHKVSETSGFAPNE